MYRLILLSSNRQHGTARGGGGSTTMAAGYERSALNVQSWTDGGDYLSRVGTQRHFERPLDRPALAAALFDADRL